MSWHNEAALARATVSTVIRWSSASAGVVSAVLKATESDVMLTCVKNYLNARVRFFEKTLNPVKRNADFERVFPVHFKAGWGLAGITFVSVVRVKHMYACNSIFNRLV